MSVCLKSLQTELDFDEFIFDSSEARLMKYLLLRALNLHGRPRRSRVKALCGVRSGWPALTSVSAVEMNTH